MFRFPYSKYYNRPVYFLDNEACVVSQYIFMSNTESFRLIRSLCYYIKRYFEVLLHRMKSFNFALSFIHVCNEWYERDCIRPLRGQVRRVSIRECHNF